MRLSTLTSLTSDAANDIDRDDFDNRLLQHRFACDVVIITLFKTCEMDICIDFDGTCVTHEFPKIGRDIGAAPILKALVAKGHRLILFTMRSDLDPAFQARSTHPEIVGDTGTYLTDALNWFHSNKIPLWGIQTNPLQARWTKSPKAYGHMYIDDAALGCPLVRPAQGRPFVDWGKVGKELEERGLI